MERVPRYTSYPTAPHFHQGVGFEQYAAWLNSLNSDKSLSLYFHIPYCKQLCWFCGCHTKIVNHYDPIKKYLSLLKEEVNLVSEYVKNSPVKHIHFGGGSPTVLESSDFVDFMELLRDKFIIKENAEIAVEMDPRTVDAEKISAYAQTGVTRSSLGVQDFDAKVQKAINRIQPYEMVADVIEELRNAGINELNIDLIYGLPYQTLESINDTIEQTLTLNPDRISLFGYAHVPWMKKHQNLIPEEGLPNKEDRIAMFEYASNFLRKAGYVAIGLDHFVKPDDSMALAAQEQILQRNFQGYTTDTADALLGMGVSSISSLAQGHVQNTSNNIDYAKAIKAKILPIVKGIALTDEDRHRRDIIMSLMSNMQAKIAQSTYSRELEQLKPYIKSGDVIYTDGILRINPKARQKLRLIASVFDSYLSDKKHQYSQAV